jgi:hypothetical protein
MSKRFLKEQLTLSHDMVTGELLWRGVSGVLLLVALCLSGCETGNQFATGGPGDLAPEELEGDVFDGLSDIQDDLVGFDLNGEPVFSDQSDDFVIADQLVSDLSTDHVVSDSVVDTDGSSELDLPGDGEIVPDVLPDIPVSCETLSHVVINELMSSNIDNYTDEDGDTSDWIELYNADAEAVVLSGWHISDDPDEPEKWALPGRLLEPGEFLLMMASGKNRSPSAGSWETRIDWGDNWSYRPITEPTTPSWVNLDFDDSSWPVGPSGFGRSDDDDATVTLQSTVYIRSIVTLSAEDKDDLTAVILHMDYDDGFVAYLNGVEVARSDNLGTTGVRPAYNELTTEGHEALLYTGMQPERFDLLDAPDMIVEGENLLAIEIHDTLDSSDLSLIPFFSLGFSTFRPDAAISETLAPWDTELHTNFSLSAEGETILLTDSAGCEADRVESTQLHADESLGRQPDGEDNWHYFMTPTPLGANETESYPGFAEIPTITPAGGFYPDGVELSLEVSSETAEIRYTLGGAEPEETSELYDDSPITDVEGGSVTVLRARAYEEGLWPSRIATGSYVNAPQEHGLGVVSLVTDPLNLWHPETGIYVMGAGAGDWFPYFGANFWQPWERPAHFEYFEEDGEVAVSMELGVRISGGWSRAFEQRSLRLVARSGYGQQTIDYPFFGLDDVASFERLILRNGGGDWCESKIEDPLFTEMARAMDGTREDALDGQAYRPAVVYLNGQYWGLYMIRERLDEYYAAAHHGGEPDNMDVVEWEWWESGVFRLVNGNWDRYDELSTYLSGNSLADDAAYETFETFFDTDSFATYFFAWFYGGGTDWYDNNIKFWRDRGDGGRWRWMLFDQDGFYGDYNANLLANSMWYSAPWLPINELFASEIFETRFINTVADYLNTYLHPDRAVEVVDQMAAEIELAIDAHMARWCGAGAAASWNGNISRIRDFVDYRPAVMRGQVSSQFGLPSTSYTLSLDVEPPQSGRFALTAVTVDAPFVGSYYRSVPMEVTAVPAPGFTFVAWDDPLLPAEPNLHIEPTASLSMVAHFSESGGARVMINEINYSSSPDMDPGDWIELYNGGIYDADLSGWYLEDAEGDEPFFLPTGLILKAGEFLVIARDSDAFQAVIPAVEPVGDLPFGLSSDEDIIKLYWPDSTLQHSVYYTDSAPWPTDAVGTGSTLELMYPESNNALPFNWSASLTLYGTPGGANSAMTGIP